MIGLAPIPLHSDLRQLTSRRPERPVLFAQGLYYLFAGLCPALAAPVIGGALAGPDTDAGLSRWIGLVVAGVGAALLCLMRREATIETARLAVAAAAVLAVADVVFVANGTVTAVYLLDAAVQIGFVLWWGRELLPRDPALVGRIDAGLA